MKLHILALQPRRREVDEDLPFQQLSHHDRRRLSQAINRSSQRQDLEKMGSLGISVISGPLGQKVPLLGAAVLEGAPMTHRSSLKLPEC